MLHEAHDGGYATVLRVDGPSETRAPEQLNLVFLPPERIVCVRGEVDRTGGSMYQLLQGQAHSNLKPWGVGLDLKQHALEPLAKKVGGAHTHHETQAGCSDMAPTCFPLHGPFPR